MLLSPTNDFEAAAVLAWQITRRLMPVAYGAARQRVRRRWRRSRVRRHVLPEVEVVLRASAVITLIVWSARLTKQFTGEKFVIESILRGEANSIVKDAQIDLESGKGFWGTIFEAPPKGGA